MMTMKQAANHSMKKAVANLQTEHDRLRPIFEAVQNADHWKGPINAIVPEGVSLEDCNRAIEFFTATSASFHKAADGRWAVSAPGYWNGPAC